LTARQSANDAGSEDAPRLVRFGGIGD